MIGIVVVSHSRALADAAVALAGEMVDKSQLPAIQVAAGLDETTFGTDAAAVAEAITAADSPDGVLVLLDLGSAVLSAELALEFLDPEVAERVRVSSAPLVEGLVAAVVTASSGAPLDAVVAEAVQGLAAKQEHLGQAPVQQEHPPQAPVESTSSPAELEPADEHTLELEVTNPHGLHARPAARLVSLVSSFDSAVRATNISTGKGPVDAASLSLVATLNLRQGDRLRLDASGLQAAEVLAAISDLAEQGFGDAETDAPDGPEPGTARSAGLGAGSFTAGSGLDIALGPAVVPVMDVDTSSYTAGSVEEELAASSAAISRVAEELADVRDAARHSVGPKEAEIFTAQLAILHDPTLESAASGRIRGGASSVHAWAAVLDEVADRFETLVDPYQRARAQDIRSIRRMLLAALMGRSATPPLDEAGILVVPEVDASTAAMLDADKVTGVVTARGGATGHGVIVARSRGIPILTDVGGAAESVPPGTLVAFDSRSAEFLVAPDRAEQRRYEDEIVARAKQRREAVSAAGEPALTSDGHRISVFANVTSVADAEEATQSGADGSGLVRTEVVFGHHPVAPSVDKQVEALYKIATALDGKPITIRTWDIGADRPVPFLRPEAEDNPFLGERGLRLCRRFPDLFADQLRAICLVARSTRVRVMFPMVTTLGDVRWAREQLSKAAADVGHGIPSNLSVGIMIEVPAAALCVASLSADLDFVSIGTNLAQYTMAADRGNTAVATLADGLEPALLQLVAGVCSRAPQGVEVGVCGDLASRPELTPVLIGLGVHELSVVGRAVPQVKAAIRATSMEDAQDLARRVLAAESPDEVRDLVSGQSR